MRIGVFGTSEEASTAVTRGVVDLLAHKPDATLGVATGSTPEGLYSELREAHITRRSTLEGSTAFTLDGYVGITDGHPEGYHNILRREFVGPEKTGLTETDLHIPVSSDADPHLATRQYEALIAAAGGVDLQILGIGANGHIGFNEPGKSLISRTRVEVLSRRTQADNTRFFDGNIDEVPPRRITQGLGTIMEARSLFLPVFDAQKAEAMHQLIEGAINTGWPTTVAQMHLDLTIFVDTKAARLLGYVDLYCER